MIVSDIRGLLEETTATLDLKQRAIVNPLFLDLPEEDIEKLVVFQRDWHLLHDTSFVWQHHNAMIAPTPGAPRSQLNNCIWCGS